MLHKPFTSPFDASFIELPSVDSTNNYALTIAREGKANHGTAFFTQEQSGGKGQMGKKWLSEKGANIALTVVLNPKPLNVTQQFQLSATVAVAACAFLEKYAGTEMKIKWPNDLYWQDRKLGGILIESIVGKEINISESEQNETSRAWKWAISGIGININQVQFPPDLINPVSLRQITGKTFDALQLAKELHAAILNGFKVLVDVGFDIIHSQYISNLYRLNESVKLKKENRVFQTVIKSVSKEGRLIVSNNGIEETFNFGEIAWII